MDFNIETMAKRFSEFEEEMPVEIRKFWSKHTELLLVGIVWHPETCAVYNFMAPDGVRVNTSVDYGSYKHISFSKRQPPFFRPDSKGSASDVEMERYLDFLEGVKVRKASPIGTAMVHFYDIGHPEAIE